MRVFGLGETVYDIIFKNETPVAAKPGGSVLNSLVSLARTNIDTYFISELGRDKVGDLISSFLVKNRININFVQSYKEAKSSLAMAFLDDSNDASYEFYKNYPTQRLTIEMPHFQEDDILLYGSSYAIDKGIRKQVRVIVTAAKKAGATIIYDPNFRPKDGADNEERIQFVLENMATADIIRGSDEDFKHLFGLGNAEAVFKKVASTCKFLIYTKNSNGIDLISKKKSYTFDVDQIEPISTIGAGDNFNAGVIYSLINKGIKNKGLGAIDEPDFTFIVKNAKQFSKEVCLSMDNYIPNGFIPV